jgi:ferredoxin like protein
MSEKTPVSETPVLSLEDKLALVKRKLDKKSHITVDQEGFKKCPDRPILFICAAKVYEENPETGECIVNFENCLECGTCQVVCRDYVTWTPPQGGYGVTYNCGEAALAAENKSSGIRKGRRDFFIGGLPCLTDPLKLSLQQ